MGPEYIDKLLSGSSAMLALVTETAGLKKKQDPFTRKDRFVKKEYLEFIVDNSKKHLLE
jgi:hypothetical protein